MIILRIIENTVAKRTINKPTLSVTLDPEVIEELKSIARAEQRSVSQIVQWALVQYFTIIRGGMNAPEHYGIEKMIGRLYSALTAITQKARPSRRKSRSKSRTPFLMS